MFRHIRNLTIRSLGSFAAILTTAACLAAADTEDVKIQDITLSIPASWKQEAPANRLRLAQFKIEPVKEDKEPAEIVVSSFGGGGGGVDANLKRWIGQFEAEGRESKVTSGECEQGKYYISDLSGTYLKPIGPPIAGKTKPAPGYRSVGVILQAVDKGVYFIKLTGPEKTVDAAVKDLRASFGGNEEKEEEYEMK